MGFKTAGKFEAAEEVNPYLEDVAAFAKENDGDLTASFEIDAPANKQSRHELWVRKAANAAGKTARLRKVNKSGVTITGQTEKGRDIVDGTVILTYTLTEKHKDGKGRKGGSEASAEATPAAPAKTGK